MFTPPKVSRFNEADHLLPPRTIKFLCFNAVDKGQFTQLTEDKTQIDFMRRGFKTVAFETSVTIKTKVNVIFAWLREQKALHEERGP